MPLHRLETHLKIKFSKSSINLSNNMLPKEAKTLRLWLKSKNWRLFRRMLQQLHLLLQVCQLILNYRQHHTRVPLNTSRLVHKDTQVNRVILRLHQPMDHLKATNLPHTMVANTRPHKVITTYPNPNNLPAFLSTLDLLNQPLTGLWSQIQQV